MTQEILKRTIEPQSRVLDDKDGIVEYVASDQSVDGQGEIIRADGWRFNRFAKNAPFVDSHNKDSIKGLLGKVIDFRVEGKRLVETVKWAVDVPENTLAQIGYAMTKGGYLKAVSVGFLPLKAISKAATERWQWVKALSETEVNPELFPRVKRIFTEQEQTELSACVVAVNPNALAKCYKDGVITEGHVEMICQEFAKCETAGAADEPELAASARAQAQAAFLEKFEKAIKGK